MGSLHFHHYELHLQTQQREGGAGLGGSKTSGCISFSLVIHLLFRQQKRGCAHRQAVLPFLLHLIGLNLLSLSSWLKCTHTPGAPPTHTQQQQLYPVRVRSLHPPGGSQRKSHHLGFSHGDARGWGAKPGAAAIADINRHPHAGSASIFR